MTPLELLPPRHGRLPSLALLGLIALPPLIPPIAAAQPPTARQASPLAGSTWQLEALQSMDDAIGRRTPPNPTAYTLRFGADGTADLRLDCNRGRAPWQASTAPGQEVSGTLRFGPLALTRALCPPPSLSDTVARQLPFVRSFLLRNNRLSLSLLADGGILEWQPLPGVPYRAVLRPRAGPGAESKPRRGGPSGPQRRWPGGTLRLPDGPPLLRHGRLHPAALHARAKHRGVATGADVPDHPPAPDRGAHHKPRLARPVAAGSRWRRPRQPGAGTVRWPALSPLRTAPSPTDTRWHRGVGGGSRFGGWSAPLRPRHSAPARKPLTCAHG